MDSGLIDYPCVIDDENRVILETLPGDPHSDYINANYITGYNKEKCYIAAQGPKPSTISDFWRMIWQEQTTIICMLANVIESGKVRVPSQIKQLRMLVGITSKSIDRLNASNTGRTSERRRNTGNWLCLTLSTRCSRITRSARFI